MAMLGMHPAKSLSKKLQRLQNMFFASIFVAVQLAPIGIMLMPGHAYAAVNPATNPTLAQSCGLDIALVIDRSNSIGNTEMNKIKNAMTGFTDALNGTPTQFSVTQFGTNASVIRNFTSNVTLVNSAINGVSTGGGGTNWEDGLLKAQGSFDPRADKPNLIIFASDGNPTYRIGGGNGYDVTQANIDAAATQANLIKNSGTRILALGIGNDLSVDNLKAISGPNANTGNVLTSDVITSGFDTLASDLATFARQTCGGTITVQKLVDADGNANTTDDRTPANNWNFNIAGTSATTSGNGQTNAIKVQPGTYSVSETLKDGYKILNASCTGATANGSYQNSTISGINVSNDNIVSCVFINTLTTGAIKVDKKLDADGNGSYESGNTEANNLGFKWTVNSTNNNFGTTVNNLTTGSYSIGETNVNGYHATGWYYTNNTAQSCANPASTNLPANIAVNDAQTTSITLCNARDTGELKVIKNVVNNNGGNATASNFQLYVKQGSTNVDGSPASGSVSGKTYTLPTNTYTVSEDPYFGYDQTSLTCIDQTTNLQVAHPVILAKGQKVTCTITNDDKAPSVTIIKEVINPYGTALPPSAFQLYLNGTPVVNNQTYTSFNAGSYSVSEDQQTGYTLTSVGGNCTSNQGLVNILLQVGVSATCKLTNTAIQPKLIVKKIVINDNSGTKKSKDFTMTVSGNSANVANFAGDSNGTTIGLNEGNYSVNELNHDGYTKTLNEGCTGNIKIGQVKTCIVTNDDIANPSIEVVKYGPATAYEGDTVTYTFVVTNTGDAKLYNVNVADDIATGEVCDATVLAPSESTNCYATYEIPTPQVENVVNTVIAGGTDPSGTTVTDTDSHTLDVLHPSINIVKDGPSKALAGTTVTYTFTVTNTGDVVLGNVYVNDPLTSTPVYVGGDANGDNILDFNETWIYTAEYSIPADQKDAILNVATVCSEELIERLDVRKRTTVLAELAQFETEDTTYPTIDDGDEYSNICDSDNHTITVSQPLVPGKGGSGPTVSTPELAMTGVATATVIVLSISLLTASLLLGVVVRKYHTAEV
ncbi:VWA domain-containing protein [Candidatus Saccharibacteria bacterium]|nr:VWA domain-containing protein [Candidatus Saccharibacteria bacterium]